MLPPETSRRLAAYRRLLDNRDFMDEFLPGFIAAAREELDQLGDLAPEAEMRRRMIRLKQAQELERDMRQFVAQAEALLDKAHEVRGEGRSSM